MKFLAMAVLLVAASAVAAAVGRRVVRRHRWVRRLERSELGVETGVAEGRLAADTGEALMQHLEGLRREISRGAGD
jgi:hypothetical protein